VRNDAPRFTLIRCNADESRLAESTRGYAEAFGEEPFQSIVVRNPPSLAAGYNRALERATGRFVILSHDDAWPVSSRAIDRVAAHLESVDVVGIAGGSRAISAAWIAAGQPHIHGHVLYPRADGTVTIVAWGCETSLVTGIRLLDGCFIAARREAAQRIGFDASRFDGFHCYDADFSYRAHRAGLVVAVAGDVSVLHRSEGAFDARWWPYNERFIAAFAATLDRDAPAPQRRVQIACPSVAEAARQIDPGLLHDIAVRLRGLPTQAGSANPQRT
jgi:GT2 family glycosyltransferase